MKLNNMLYVAIDANEVGRQLECFILSSELCDLKNFSNNLTKAINNIKDFVTCHDGEVFMAGGDNILAQISQDQVSNIMEFVKVINQKEPFCFSIGIGTSPANAYLALKYAKVRKHFAMQYSNDIFIHLDDSDVIN